MSKFKPGTSGNPNGRRRGKPNRSTEELRNIMKDFFELNIETLQTSFNGLEAKEKINTMLRICQLIMPAPVHDLERLTDQQLDEIILRLKNQHQNLRIS